MKSYLIPFVLILCSLLATSAIPVGTGKFIIEVDELRNSEGSVWVILYEKEGFLEEDAVKGRFRGTINNQKSTIHTDPLPHGEYGMVIFHDENDNKEVDFNFFKMPKEGIGFSNNPKIGLSKPGFEESKVVLNSAQKKIRIKLKYF